MKSIFSVCHIYDVDGGFGDAVSQEKVLFVTDSKAVAEEFVAKYSNDHVYDRPYRELHCGHLVLREQSIVETFEDIPQEHIEWGKKNIQMKDCEDDCGDIYCEDDCGDIWQ